MGLFAVDYQDVPGECVCAQGGLKFRADEEALRRYFSQILPYASLNDLIGEAVFWVLFPSSLAVWTFPFFLYFEGVAFALVITVVLFLVAGIAHQYIYLKSVNYLVFILGNRLLQLAGYIVWTLIFFNEGSLSNILILGAWFIFFALGFGDSMLGLLPILFRGRVFSLPLPDQVLRTVGVYYGTKFEADPLTWKMYDEEKDGI